MACTHSYILEESDLDEHWRDFSGRFWHPSKIGVPLCSTCDTIIRDGLCSSCAKHALLDLTVKQITGERWQVAA